RVKVGTNAALIAPSAKRSRIRLGMRNATRKASISSPAPKSPASTVSRTRPRMRLVSVAAPPRPALPARPAVRPTSGPSPDGAVAGFWLDKSSGQLAAHELVDGLAVDRLAGERRHGGLHDAAHVLRGGGAGVGDGRVDGALESGGVGGGREIADEHGDLGGLLV